MKTSRRIFGLLFSVCIFSSLFVPVYAIETNAIDPMLPENAMSEATESTQDIIPKIMLNCTASYTTPQPIAVYNDITGADTGVKIAFTAYGDYVVNDTTGKIDAAFTPVRYDAKVIGVTGHTVIGGETDENPTIVISSDRKTVSFYSRYRAAVRVKSTGTLIGYLDQAVTITGRAN